MDLVFFRFTLLSFVLQQLSLSHIEATSYLPPDTSSLDNKSTNATKIITNNIHTPPKREGLGGEIDAVAFQNLSMSPTITTWY